MGLLIILLLIIVLIIIATTRFNLHPFLTLLLASVAMGFAAGLSANTVLSNLMAGFGKTLSSIGIIIAFGTIIGAYLEKSGGATAMANAVLKLVGEKRSALAMNITGFIVSIPVFCDSGFVILSTLNKALSKKTKTSLVFLAVSLAAGLYATHVFVPPTPGPLAAAAALNADLGLVILLGLLIAIPASLSGYLWARTIGRKITISVEKEFELKEESNQLPGTGISFAPIVVPIVLIALRSVSNYPTHPFGVGVAQALLKFIGHPISALLVGVFLAFLLKGKDSEGTHFSWVNDGLREAGIIILITGAGGAFGAVLRSAGIGDIIGQNLSHLQLGVILPFLLAAVLKTAQGSSTVSIITTAAIVSPLLEPFGLASPLGRALTVLAIGAGAMTVSHLNDSFFWVVAQFSNMDTATALKSQTVATFFQGMTSIVIIAIVSWIFI